MTVPWIGLALVTEGVSDDRFLSQVLRRSAQDLGGPSSEVPDPLLVRSSTGPGRRRDIVSELERQDGAYNVIVYHRDGGTRPDREVGRWVDPFRHACREAGREDPVVAVIPVQETEAWALADADTLCTVLGVVDRTNRRLGLPQRGRQVEEITSPKEFLHRLTAQVTSWDVDFLQVLGEKVRLTCLRELPAFRRWENDLNEALHTVPGFSTR